MNPMGVIGKVGLLAPLAAWPLSAQHPTARDSAVVGCYALTWASESNREAPAPDTIALTLLLVPPPPYALTRAPEYVVRADAGWERRYGTSHFYWQHLRADTVLVSMTDGLSGVGLLAVRAATGLQGIATYGSDNAADTVRIRWKVKARRTACLGFP